MVYGVFKDLSKITASNKVLKNKPFNIVKNIKYDRYERGLASMAYKFFDKKFTGSGIKNKITQNQQLAVELHKPIIRKFKLRKLYSSFNPICPGVFLSYHAPECAHSGPLA